MLQLTLRTPGGYEIICPQKSVFTVGRRDEANHKQIDVDFAEIGENGVSRLHLVVFIEKDSVRVQDFNSRNGTYLNEQLLAPMKQYQIQSRDVIVIGRVALTATIDHQA